MLDEKTRKDYLMELGYASIKDFQRAVMYPKYVDGVYGQQTENALISAINVKRYTKNFSVKEFRCECGGRYCCGYPSTLKPELLKNIQSIRDHYSRPITVTCGLRDKTYNSKLGGSIQNSLHLTGQAVDFYQVGVTDTLANRKKSIKWIKTLPNHHYTYGNGINSNGYKVSAPYMGNALHTDVSKGSAPAPSPYDDKGKLICDGLGGSATVKEMQRFFGTTKDSIVSGQNATLMKKYCPSLTAYKSGKGGSPMIKNLQRWVGVSQDGVIGQNTVKAWQKKIGVSADGIFGKNSMKAWQKYLNEHDKAVYPIEPTPPAKSLIDKEIEACIVQADWMKNYKYKWQQNPTIPKSKKYGTCVTYVACVLQRIGILKSGQFIWISNKGKVEGANSKMTVTYPSGTLKSNKSKLKRGDIVIGGNGKTGAGAGSHIFILTGKWDGDNPYIYDQDSAGRVKKGKSPQHTWKGSFKMIALIRLK